MLTQVLLADEQVILCDGLKRLLRPGGYNVVAEARDGEEAVRLARKHRPDVAVLEIQLPRLNGVEAARQIILASPGTRIVFLTMLKTDLHILDVFQDGVRAIVQKTQPAGVLLRAMDEVRRGGIYMGLGVSAAVPPARVLVPTQITSRERQVLELVAAGKTSRQIANTLAISVKTAGFHRAHIMQKLNIHHTAGLVRYAVRHGLITP